MSEQAIAEGAVDCEQVARLAMQDGSDFGARFARGIAAVLTFAPPTAIPMAVANESMRSVGVMSGVISVASENMISASVEKRPTPIDLWTVGDLGLGSAIGAVFPLQQSIVALGKLAGGVTSYAMSMYRCNEEYAWLTDGDLPSPVTPDQQRYRAIVEQIP